MTVLVMYISYIKQGENAEIGLGPESPTRTGSHSCLLHFLHVEKINYIHIIV